VDLGTIQYSVEANTTDIDRANDAADKMADQMKRAGDATDALGKKITDTAKKSNQLGSIGRGASEAGEGVSNLGKYAQAAGYQLQDVAVQVQMGTSAFTILGQQGSQLASAFGPTGVIVGAVLAVGAAIGGVLFQSLMSASKAMEDLGDNAEEMAKSIRDLTEAERIHLDLANRDITNKKIKESNDLTKSINKQEAAIKKLNAENGRQVTKYISTGPGVAPIAYQQTINNTKKIKKEQEELNALTLQYDVINKKISEDYDIEGAKKLIQSLRDRTAMVGLHGDALYRQKGIQAGLTKENLEAYVVESKRFNSATVDQYIKSLDDETLALKLKNAEIVKNTALAKELSAQVSDTTAKKQGGTSEQQQKIKDQLEINRAMREENDIASSSVSLYEQQEKSAKDKILSLKRDVDLFGIISKAQQTEYDIRSGLVKINGGINSAQAKEMLNLTKILDLNERKLAIDKSAEAVAFSGFDNSKNNLESSKMQYELDNGILKVNESLTNEYYSQLIANKKLEESKESIKKIDDLIVSQQREIDIGGNATRVQKTIYDIKNGILNIENGIESAQAKQLINQAKILDSNEKTKSLIEFSEDAAERINGVFADVWVGLLDGSMDVFDGIKKAFFQTIAEMAHEAITKPIILNIQQSLTGGGSSVAQGAGIGKAGLYAAAAAVTVSLVGLWNKKQDEKFLKLTAEYKQANQGLSAILGEGNKHSQSIAKSIEHLDSVNGNVLDVNYQMLFTLQDIRTGIAQTAAGFSKTLTRNPVEVSTGTSTLNSFAGAAITGGYIGIGVKLVADAIGGEIGSFINNVIDKVSKAIYSKSKKVIDTGIEVFGSSLGEIISGGVIQAQSYADIKTTTKVVGIKTDSDLNRKSEDLGNIFEQQFTDVFESAGDALKEASKVFGINFDEFSSRLLIKAQDISLKDLEGDELTAAIETFFSSTLDSWAETILKAQDNTDGMFSGIILKTKGKVGEYSKILLDFQEVGEGAFDTMVRLASQTNTFVDYVGRLGLNMSATGLAAIYAGQNVAELSGGFDALSSSLAVYYDKFFSLDDKIKEAGESIQDYFGDLGLSVPKTREEFKNLISALDLTDDAQAKQFASLIKVSGALDQYIDALDDQAEAAKAAQIEIAQNAYSGLSRAVDAQKKIIDKQIASMNEALSVSRSVYAALGSALDGMVISSKKTQEATRRQAQGQLSDMLGAAKGGNLPNIDDLNNALSVISQPSESLYGSFQEYAADFYATANTIKDLQDIAGAQVSTDEKSLAELEKQSTALDDLLVWGKAQLDVLSGIDISVLSVAEALRSFASAAGVESPATQNKRFIDMAAGSSLETVTPQQQTAIDEAKQQAAQREKQDQDFKEFMRASQLAVADNTDKIKKILDKFDTVGMPPERAV